MLDSSFGILKENKKNIFIKKRMFRRYFFKKECPICMEEKKLDLFCLEGHEFCKKCCKDWMQKSNLCPFCRKNCVNKKYSKYNYELINLDYNYFKDYAQMYFLLWHSPKCLKKFHKFVIYETTTNKIVFCCKNCNIEQVFN